MTTEELQKIKDWIATLKGDAAAGAKAALDRILAGRMPPPGGGFPPPPEIGIDPDLLDPEDPDMPRETPPKDDLEIDDPEDLLKSKGSGDDGDDDDDEDSDDEEGDKPKDKKKHGKPKDSTDDSDSDGDPSGTDSRDSSDSDGLGRGSADRDVSFTEPDMDFSGPAESGSEEGAEDDDLVDDTAGRSLPKELTRTAETEERRKNEVFRRKVEAASVIKQIKKALKKPDLSDEAREELTKLKDQLTDMLSKLKENGDEEIDKTSAAEFNDLIEKAQTTLEKEAGVHVTKIDVKSRLTKIQQDLDNTIENDEMEDEDRVNLAADPEEKKRRAAELEKERIKRMTGADGRNTIEQFKKDLERAIGDQIEDMIEQEEETYAKVNRTHEEDPIIAPGVRIDEIPNENKPSIDVYFDQSGSWSSDDVKYGMAAIKDLLGLEEDGLILLNIFYFSEILTTDQPAARARGGQECWDLIIDNIMAPPKTKNVIIMTDTDISHDYGYAGHRGCIHGKRGVVDGCVWYLWKNGRREPSAREALKGKKGTFEYNI